MKRKRKRKRERKRERKGRTKSLEESVPVVAAYGQTVRHEMRSSSPSAASSRRRLSVIAMAADLLAQYSAKRPEPSRPITEETVTNLPPGAPSAVIRACGRANGKAQPTSVHTLLSLPSVLAQDTHALDLQRSVFDARLHSRSFIALRPRLSPLPHHARGRAG